MEKHIPESLGRTHTVARQFDGTTRPPVAWDRVRAISVGMPMMATVGVQVK